MVNTNKPAEFSEAEIAAFEGKDTNRSRGKVQLVQFPSDVTPDTPARFWIAKPNRQQLAMMQDAGTSTEKNNDLLINTGVLAGDLDQLQYDDELFFGLLGEVQGLVAAKKKL